MCTRANSASVPNSFHALVNSTLALAGAIMLLVVALATVPWRAAGSQATRHGKPASTRHIEVQVHLNDRQRARAIERSCRDALRRAARTWAPFPLPLDRVEVAPSAPPLGKADIFDQWLTASHQGEPGGAALVVVALGTSIDGRELRPEEIAGALAAQIERLVIERVVGSIPRRTRPQRARNSNLASCLVSWNPRSAHRQNPTCTSATSLS
ncbi:MAG: hypothetical protein JO352_39935 [Chloroflexi bacterium]|nr:hypothetical protein [Chloroflexota bacterium]